MSFGMGGVGGGSSLSKRVASFPVIEAVNKDYAQNVSSTSIALPAGVQAGDLLLLFAMAWRNSGVSFNIPSNWTSGFASTSVPQSYVRGLWRVATGPLASVTLSGGSSSYWSAISFRISNYDGNPSFSSVSVSANPPSLNLGAVKKALWLALIIGETGPNTDPANWPTGYSDLYSESRGGAGPVSSTRRFLAAASENPSAYIPASAGTVVSVTVGVAGA